MKVSVNQGGWPKNMWKDKGRESQPPPPPIPGPATTGNAEEVKAQIL